MIERPYEYMIDENSFILPIFPVNYFVYLTVPPETQKWDYKNR